MYPDSEAAQAALLAYARRHGSAPADEFVRFARLVELCAPQATPAQARLTPVLARGLLTSAMAQVGPGPFGAAVRSPAFLDSVLQVIRHLRLNDVDPASLRDALAAHHAARRVHFVAACWAVMEEKKRQAGVRDHDDDVALATEACLAALPERLRPYSRIEVYGLYDESPRRRKFWAALGRAAGEASRPLVLQFVRSAHPSVDGLPDNLATHFERAWAQSPLHELVFDHADERPFNNLVGAALDSRAGREGDRRPRFFHAPTPAGETAELARRCRVLLEAGTAPERIAVFVTDPRTESHGFARAFEAAGVPLEAAPATPLLNTAAGHLACAIPELMAAAFPAELMAEFLDSQHAARVHSGTRHARAIFTAAGVYDNARGATRTEGAYRVRLGQLAERTRPDETRSPTRAQVDDVRTRAALLIDTARTLPRRAPLAVLVDAWWQVVLALGLAQPPPSERSALDDVTLAEAEATDALAAERLVQLRDELRRAAGEPAAALDEVSLEDFGRWLVRAAAEHSVVHPSSRRGGVQLLAYRSALTREFEHVFCAGLVDAVFPRREGSLPLVTDAERRATNEAVPGAFRLFTGDAERLSVALAEDRLWMHAATAAATQSLTLSFSTSDGDGHAQQPSVFFEGPRRLANAQVDAAPALNAISLEQAVGHDEFELAVALDGVSPAETRWSEPLASPADLRAALGARPFFRRLARASAQEFERYRFFQNADAAAGTYSGDFRASPRLSALLAFGPDAPLNASTLQAWATCRFKGACAHVLRLRGGEEASEEALPREESNFEHELLARAAAWLKDHGRFQPNGVVHEPDAREAVEAVAAAVIAAFEAESSTGHPLVWNLQKQAGRERVVRMLQEPFPVKGEIAAQPDRFEFQFGDPRAPRPFDRVALGSPPTGQAPVFVKGRIDRIDRGPSGTFVIDYKRTVDKARLVDAYLVTDFQLPLYAWVLEQAGESVVDAAWMGLRKTEGVPLSEVRDAERAAETPPLEAMWREVAGVRSGAWGPHSKDCAHCDFAAVCRISARLVRTDDGGGDA